MPIQPLQSALDALRERMQAELDTQLADIGRRHAEALVEARRSWEAEARQQSSSPAAQALPSDAVHAGQHDRAGGIPDSDTSRLQRVRNAQLSLSGSPSLAGMLEVLASAAAAEVSRSALFVVSGDTLRRWSDSGFPEDARLPPVIGSADRHPIADAARTRVPATSAPSDAGTSASEAVALPILIGGESVAVLYAEQPSGAKDDAGGRDTLDMLVQHASACLALHTATRTLQVFGVRRNDGLDAAGPADADGDSARRYARLLVSEIKLYNEAAVRAGRERRDLLARLGPEIDRARRLYEDRVPPAMFNRAHVFEQELVHTLAEGDPTLLGAPA